MNCNPSAINAIAIIIKNDKAKILKDGCLFMKSEIGFDAINMMAILTITAVNIIHNSSTNPTAVMMESTEKTKSNKMI